MSDNASGKGLEALSDAVTAAMSSPDKAGSKLAKSLGCKCRKSHCLKHYCECFHNSLKCGPHCKCVRKKCENGNGKPKKEGSSSRSKSGRSKSSSNNDGVSAPAAPPVENTMMPPPLPQQQQQQQLAMSNNNLAGGAGAVGFQSFPGQAPSIATATVQYPGFNAAQSPQGMMGMPQIGGATMAYPQLQPQPPQNNFAPQGNAMAGFSNPNNNMQFYLQQLQMAQQNAGGFPLPQQQQQPQQALNFGGQFAPQQMAGYGQQAPNVGNMASLPQQQPMMQFPPPQQQQQQQGTAQPAGGDTKSTGGASTGQAQLPVAPDGSNASNAAAAASSQPNAEVGGEAPEAALLLLRTNTQNPLILAEKVLGPRPTSKEKAKLNAWNYKYKKIMKTGYEEIRKELQNNRRHQSRIRDKLSKEEQRLAEVGKSMDAKDRKKYDDMLHDLEEKKMALEEKRKKINENEKVWQRECRELKKMQIWSRPGVPNSTQHLPSGPPPPAAAQGIPPPQLHGGDMKPAASQMVDEDAKKAADYAVAQAEAALAADGKAYKSKEESGGGKESKKRKSSSRSSSRSKRKSRSTDAEADVGDTAAV